MDNDHRFFSLRATKLALITRKSKIVQHLNNAKVFNELIVGSDDAINLLQDQIVWLDDMITATQLMIEESLKSEIPF